MRRQQPTFEFVQKIAEALKFLQFWHAAFGVVGELGSHMCSTLHEALLVILVARIEQTCVVGFDPWLKERSGALMFS